MSDQNKPRGFGDDIQRIAKVIQADKAAKEIAKALGKEDCGCSKRQESLNNPDLLINKVFYKNKNNQDENIKE